MTELKKIKKTTIYDLAELTGVSASAVSTILNGNWKKRRISVTLAEKVTRIAEEQGYIVNHQASRLRSKKSNSIGMIVPKYDNRYFGSIAEQFEEMARDRGMLPIITCTRRNPEMEIEATNAMLSWQVDWLIATGTTYPDKITELCHQAGVPTINLDLPGTLAPSVISDNYSGAKELTQKILSKSENRYGIMAPLRFIGGRISDYNTTERIRGFQDAHKVFGISIPNENLLVSDYSSDKIYALLNETFRSPTVHLPGIFVNSTISLEGVMRWLVENGITGIKQPPMGCFDWDPFVSLLGHDIDMMRQDVPTMLNAVFDIIDSGNTTLGCIQVPPVITFQR